MRTLCVILARAGSKGLPNKNSLPLNGKRVIDYTIEYALNSKSVDEVIVSTDCPKCKASGRRYGVTVVDRPAELATDEASVLDAARHAVGGRPGDVVVILYGNVPVRPPQLIENVVKRLYHSPSTDAIHSAYPAGKHHADWQVQLDSDGIIVGKRNHRRQELHRRFQLDGGIFAMQRDSLDQGRRDYESIVLTKPGEVIDIDDQRDFDEARRVIGPQPQPPLMIVAEIGVNHCGDYNKAVQLVHDAKNAGADAVKFQLVEPAMDRRFDMKGKLVQWMLPCSEMMRLKELANELGMKFILTPFLCEQVYLVEHYDPAYIKIASPDASNLPLIESMLSLGKPLLISTGGHTLDELEPTVDLCAGHDVTLMHCVSKYPTMRMDADLNRIFRLRERFGLPVGYSDHTACVEIATLAMSREAWVIEHHIRGDWDAPDNRVSLDRDQFAESVLRILESEFVFSHRLMWRNNLSGQSLTLAHDLFADSTLCRADLTTSRPGDGIPASKMNDMIGRRVKCDAKKGQLLTTEMLA